MPSKLLMQYLMDECNRREAELLKEVQRVLPWTSSKVPATSPIKPTPQERADAKEELRFFRKELKLVRALHKAAQDYEDVL